MDQSLPLQVGARNVRVKFAKIISLCSFCAVPHTPIGGIRNFTFMGSSPLADKAHTQRNRFLTNFDSFVRLTALFGKPTQI